VYESDGMSFEAVAGLEMADAVLPRGVCRQRVAGWIGYRSSRNR